MDTVRSSSATMPPGATASRIQPPDEMTSGSRRRSKEYTTSDASTGRPVVKVAFSRKKNRYVKVSASKVHRVAKQGATVKSAANSTNPS